MPLSVQNYLSERDTLLHGGCGEEEGIETQAITGSSGVGIVSVVEQPYTDNEQLLYCNTGAVASVIAGEQEGGPEPEDDEPLLDRYLDFLPAGSLSHRTSPARTSTNTSSSKGVTEATWTSLRTDRETDTHQSLYQVEVSEDEKITFIRPLSSSQVHGGSGTATTSTNIRKPTTKTRSSAAVPSVRSTSAASVDSYRRNQQLYDQHYCQDNIEGFEGVFDDHPFTSSSQNSKTATSCSSGGGTARTVNIEEDELLLQLGQHGTVNAIAIDKDGFLKDNHSSKSSSNNNSSNKSKSSNYNYNSTNSILVDLLSTDQSKSSKSKSKSTANYSSRIGKVILPRKNKDIDCTKSSSSTSVSTMTKGASSHGNSSTFHSTTGSQSFSSSPRFRQGLLGGDAHQSATKKNNKNNNDNDNPNDDSNNTSYCLGRKKRSSPTNNKMTTPQTRNSNHNNSHHRGKSISKALSKLALCGQSARESTLDLEFLVLSLRQALTGPEAAKALRDIVQVLKRSRSGNTNSQSNDDHAFHPNISAMSCAELQQELAAKGADHCVISTLWNFPSNVAVQYYGIVALGELVAHGNMANQNSIVLKGGIEVVLTAMKTNAMEESIQEEACRTLKNIMKYYDEAKHQVARHKGIARILQAMMTHPEYANVQRQACYALTSLSCLKSISDELVIKQAHAVLIKTMSHHNDDPYVLAEAWRTLTNIVIHAMNTNLDQEIASHGMSLICKSLDKFADCTVVPIQARGLTLLTHLCYRSSTNLERVTQTDTLETIYRILRIWNDDEKVQAAGDKLVQQISRAGYPRVNNAAMAIGRRSRSSGSSRSGVPSAPGEPIFRRTSNSNTHHRSSSIFGGGFFPRPSGSRGHSAVIGQIRNDSGMDVILDSTQRY